MSGDRISDEAVQAALDVWDVCDSYSEWESMRSAIAAALPLLEGGKGEKAVQDELPLATPVPPVDWKAVYANEATKFRAETIRTSELTAMVKRCVSVLIDDHPPGPWSRGCIRCKIVEDAEELLARPINVAAIPLYTAPQPAAQQPVGDDFTEVKDHHTAAAIAAIKADPDALFDMFAQSSFWKEHAMFLYDNSEQFQAEIARSKRVVDDAQALADEEARKQADECEFERAELLRESRYER